MDKWKPTKSQQFQCDDYCFLYNRMQSDSQQSKSLPAFRRSVICRKRHLNPSLSTNQKIIDKKFLSRFLCGNRKLIPFIACQLVKCSDWKECGRSSTESDCFLDVFLSISYSSLVYTTSFQNSAMTRLHFAHAEHLDIQWESIFILSPCQYGRHRIIIKLGVMWSRKFQLIKQANIKLTNNGL